MLLAADDRYREAEELIVAEEFDGATHLLGYAAEMWLKAACLGLRGLGPTTQVKSALPPLRAWMKLVAPSILIANFHDLAFLGECVVRLRLYQGRPLTTALLFDLRLHIINGLHVEWVEDMRYRRTGRTATEVWAALVQTWWIKSNWIQLT